MSRFASKLALFLAVTQCSPALAEGIMVATGAPPSQGTTETQDTSENQDTTEDLGDDEDWICIPAGGPGSVFSVPPPQGSWSIPNSDGAIILVLSAGEYATLQAQATALTPAAWAGYMVEYDAVELLDTLGERRGDIGALVRDQIMRELAADPTSDTTSAFGAMQVDGFTVLDR